jgi:hypothetical protein
MVSSAQKAQCTSNMCLFKKMIESKLPDRNKRIPPREGVARTYNTAQFEQYYVVLRSSSGGLRRAEPGVLPPKNLRFRPNTHDLPFVYLEVRFHMMQSFAELMVSTQ